MSRRILCVSILVILLISSCNFIDRARMRYRYRESISENDSIFLLKKKNENFYPIRFDETSRLFYIAKVWGFVKYHHKNKWYRRHCNIDDVLIKAMEQNKTCQTKDEFNNILLDIISSIQVDELDGENRYPSMEDYALINNKWMNDTVFISKEVSEKLNDLFLKHTGAGNDFIKNKSSTGQIVLSNEETYNEEFPEETIRLVGLFRYWNIINYFFVYKNDMENNWDKVLYESIPRFQNVSTKKEYHLEVARLTNYLDDGHANMPTLNDETIIGEFSPNFNIINIKDTFLISQIILPDENPEGFMLGDIVLAINDKDIKHLYDSLKNFLGSGSYWAEQRYIGYMMLSDHIPEMRFKILRNDTDTLDIVSDNKSIYETVKKWSQNSKKEKQYRWINDSTAYLKLEFITKSNFDENYKNIKNAKNIILDLRSYPDNYIFEELTDAFVPPATCFSVITYPDTRFPGMVRYIRNSVKLGSKDHFKGTVIVLVNERTGSFSEYLTMALQQNPKVITVGRSTAGSDGNIIRMKLPGDIETWHSGVGIYYPDMTPTQRVGVKIDYTAEPTAKDIKNNIDVALKKAIELSNNSKNQNS